MVDITRRVHLRAKRVGGDRQMSLRQTNEFVVYVIYLKNSTTIGSNSIEFI